MSLTKQLWLGILIILLLALGGSFMISIKSAKSYLEEQLNQKNKDDATSLALSLSIMQKYPATMEILVYSQFDTGHYKYILVADAQHKTLVQKQDQESNTTQAPDWFSNILPLKIEPGTAQIQDGWEPFGSIRVESKTTYAKDALWKSTKKLFIWFSLASLFCGLLGSLILRRIISPLTNVVKQAEAISDRQFLMVAEPKTLEFKSLVKSMNTLCLNVKVMLEKETQQLETLRARAQQDPLTGLANRDHFFSLLESKLNHGDADGSGMLIIGRMLNLAELNNTIGRTLVDDYIVKIAAALQEFSATFPDAQVGRLNSRDYAIVIAESAASSEIYTRLKSILFPALPEHWAFPLAVCHYNHGDTRGVLLQNIDGGLARAELKGNRAIVTLPVNQPHANRRHLIEWRATILQSLESHRMELTTTAVKSTEGKVLHHEVYLRLLLDNELQPSGHFAPWASRLGILPNIDLVFLTSVLASLSNVNEPWAIKISADSLCDSLFRENAIKLIKENKYNKNLCIEFPEACAVRHMNELRTFSSTLRSLGCQVGLAHAGIEFTKIRELENIGLHFLKIDRSLLDHLNDHQGNRLFLEGLCKIGHSLGIAMIAEYTPQFENSQELARLGIDAMTNPPAWQQTF
jgi:EAL domain-containing protein (putative c-di-GMP-specific phosphodiesterase class I)/GGDEF domain-containing protein